MSYRTATLPSTCSTSAPSQPRLWAPRNSNRRSLKVRGLAPTTGPASLQALTGSDTASNPSFSTITYGEDLGWRTDFSSHYVRGKLLGLGSFGEVYNGVDLHTGKDVAIKVMPKTRGKLNKERTLEKIALEVGMMQRLVGCRGIVQLEECFEEQDSVSVVTEICLGGDLQRLSDTCGPFSEHALALVAVEVLKTLQRCHERGVLHGDVKPANFVLKQQHRNPLQSADPAFRSLPWLKAIDFGCSQLLEADHLPLTKRTGTPVFMAPEIFARSYSHEADLWSTGVMLYQLFSQNFPFWRSVSTCKAANVEEVAEAVADAEIFYDYGPWLTMSPEGLEFVQGFLNRDSRQRITVQQALQHPWLAKALDAQTAARPMVGGNNIVRSPVHQRRDVAAAV